MPIADLLIGCTKPEGAIAQRLAAQGIGIRPVEGPEKCDRYLLSDRLAVDRKTVTDFVNAIADKRLFADAIDLGESFELGLVIVEGEGLYGSIRSFHPNAIRGALSALVLQYGLAVLRTADEDDSAALLAMMAAHEQRGVPEISLHPKRKAADLPDMQRRVVEMLPGAGLVVARALLQRFGSIRRIAEASDEELASVRGLGPKRAGEIRRVLEAEYEAIDTERDVEDAIARDPSILFPFPVVEIARQHVLPLPSAWRGLPSLRSTASSAWRGLSSPRAQADVGARGVLDLVYISEERRELYVVELKRGELTDEHLAQLVRYLDEAARSELIGAFLSEGYTLRGILASPAGAALGASDPRIEVRVLPEEPILAALRAARGQSFTVQSRSRGRLGDSEFGDSETAPQSH